MGDFTRLDPGLLNNYIFEKSPGYWVKNGKIFDGRMNKQFLSVLDSFAIKHQSNAIINNEQDLSNYYFVKHFEKSSGEGGEHTNCACGHLINAICSFGLKCNPDIQIQVGNECVHKINDKILNEELNYQRKKFEGKTCTKCSDIVQQNNDCFKVYSLCRPCYDKEYSSCKICKEIVNPENKSFKLSHCCFKHYKSEKEKERKCKVHEEEQKIRVLEEEQKCKVLEEEQKLRVLEEAKLPCDRILCKNGNYKNKTLGEIYNEKDGLKYLTNLLNWENCLINQKCLINQFLQEKFNDSVKDRTKIINFLPLFKVPVEKNPENYIINYGNYKDKPLSYIFDPDGADNLQLLIKLVKNNHYAKDNIILFLKQMFKNNIYPEKIKNEFIENQLSLILICD